MKQNSLIHIPEPKVSLLFFGSSRFAWLWLIVRLFVGYQWLMAGWGKIQNPAWVGENAGAAIHGFIIGAVAKTAGAHPDVSGWYASFLQNFVDANAVSFSYLISYGEIAIGVALILGLFTGIAAFFGAFMNYNFLLAGTLSINPILFFLQLLLVLAWRVAGWYGLDRYALRYLGAPWQPGTAFTNK